MRAHERMKIDGRLVVSGPQGQVGRVFQLSGLDEALTLE
jgi:hypothetical protein